MITIDLIGTGKVMHNERLNVVKNITNGRSMDP